MDQVEKREGERERREREREKARGKREEREKARERESERQRKRARERERERERCSSSWRGSSRPLGHRRKSVTTDSENRRRFQSCADNTGFGCSYKFGR
jgi:hypothetical protein